MIIKHWKEGDKEYIEVPLKATNEEAAIIEAKSIAERKGYKYVKVRYEIMYRGVFEI